MHLPSGPAARTEAPNMLNSVDRDVERGADQDVAISDLGAMLTIGCVGMAAVIEDWSCLIAHD